MPPPEHRGEDARRDEDPSRRNPDTARPAVRGRPWRTSVREADAGQSGRLLESVPETCHRPMLTPTGSLRAATIAGNATCAVKWSEEVNLVT